MTQPEKPPAPPGRPSQPVKLPPPDMLTPAEIEDLLRSAKEGSEYARKAFAHLRPKAEPKGEK